MPNIILFDDETREWMLPLSYTRPVAEFRTGILTTRERWERLLGGRASHITADFLAGSYPMQVENDNLVINGAVLPNDRLLRLVELLEPNEALMTGGQLVAARLNHSQFDRLVNDEPIEEITGIELDELPFIQLHRPWDILASLRATIEFDYHLLTQGRTGAPIAQTNQVISPDNIFLEDGAVVQCAILNAQSGPIYIGRNAQVMEGAILRGPVTIGEGAVVKMGARIYGPTVIGPGCRAGGEIKEVVMFANSNKAHDGYLGNSILGEWCNLGAGTTVSNLKNNYSPVRMWDYRKGGMIDTGLMQFGMVMGDHSKAGIQTMFNTGTTVGVAANIFGEGFPPKFIPSFSWGGADGMSTHRIEDALVTAARVMERRGQSLTADTASLLRRIFEVTASYR